MRPFRSSFTLSVAGWPITAAPVSRTAATTASRSEGRTRGRAASWTSTTAAAGERAARPASTES